MNTWRISSLLGEIPKPYSEVRRPEPGEVISSYNELIAVILFHLFYQGIDETKSSPHMETIAIEG